jgi:hypothetical protein
MRSDLYNAPNPEFGQFELMRNDPDSSYQALQAQFRHGLAHGFQTLLSYTWGHSIDDASSDANYLNVPPGGSPLECASSDQDIRHTFSDAVSITSPHQAVESGRRFLGTGLRLRSFTRAPRHR